MPTSARGTSRLYVQMKNAPTTMAARAASPSVNGSVGSVNAATIATTSAITGTSPRICSVCDESRTAPVDTPRRYIRPRTGTSPRGWRRRSDRGSRHADYADAVATIAFFPDAGTTPEPNPPLRVGLVGLSPDGTYSWGFIRAAATQFDANRSRSARPSVASSPP